MSLFEYIKRLLVVSLLCVSLVGAAACTHIPQDKTEAASDDYDENDPLEPLNRVFFTFNQVIDFLILKPITFFYQAIVPEEGRMMVSNAVDNLYSPITFANSILQGDIDNSIRTFWRFTINSTFGIGGLYDVAAIDGLTARETGFGDTLAVYGAEPGAYLVLPIIGPSNIRDGIGRAGDVAAFPFTWIDEGTALTMGGVALLDARSQNSQIIDDIYATSLDPYVTFRSVYSQKRASDVSRTKRLREQAVSGK